MKNVTQLMQNVCLRKIRAVMLYSLLLSVSFLQISCDGEEEVEDEQKDPRQHFLTTWTVTGGGYVKKDGVEVSSLNTLELTILENSTYRSTGGTTDQQFKVFFAQGTWSWQGTGATKILRDEIETNISELTANSVILKFNMSVDDAGNINGRPASIVGNYEIKLVKK
jgi:hypothetical protein